MPWISQDGANNRRHIYPLTLDMPDIPHDAGTRLVRHAPDPLCPLCKEGRCWQELRLDSETGARMVIHGTVVA
jgi:hypothetical protein